MSKGSCMCGEIKYETGETEAFALCHCTDCQKWSGGAYTSNIVVPRSSFKVVAGKPKEYDLVGDSGKINKHFFCGTCGSSLYTELEIMPDKTCVKAGGLDNGATDQTVAVEFYTKSKVSYQKEIEGAKQVPAFG